MNSGPPKTLEFGARFLLPAGAQEHVLGDLREIYAETGSAVGYVIDALVTLPYVIRGQAARNLDWRLVGVEALALAASVALGSLRMTVETRAEALPAMVCTVLVAVGALMLGDIYVEPRNRGRLHTFGQILLAYGSAWLAGSLLSGLVPLLAPMRAVVAESARSGIVLLAIGRIVSAHLLGEGAPPAIPVTAEEIRRESHRFHRRIRERNLTEYAGTVVAVASCAIAMVHTPVFLLRAGLLLAIPGLLWAAYELYRRASSRPLPAELGESESRAFYRSELARQRDAMKDVHRWYMGPLLPAAILLLTGPVAFTGRAWSWRLAGSALVWTAFLVLMFWLNRRGARTLQKQIDALDSLEKQ